MPPKGKRKRVSSPGEGPQPSIADDQTSSSSSKKSRLNNGAASDAAGKVEVVYELVGTDKKCTRSMADESLNTVVPGIASDLGINMLGVRFTHLRNSGFETDVWDDFDFRAIRDRAMAQGSRKEVIRVYSGAMGREPTPSHPSSSTPSSSTTHLSANAHDPNASAPNSNFGSGPSTVPRSALRTPGMSTPRSEKRNVSFLQADSPPSTPSPAPGPPKPTKNQKRRQRKSYDAQQASKSSPASAIAGPSNTQGASSSLSPLDAARQEHVERLVSAFKPTRPSPLSQSNDSTPPAKKAKKDGETASPNQNGKQKQQAQPAKSNADKAAAKTPLVPPPAGDIPPTVGAVPPQVGTVAPATVAGPSSAATTSGPTAAAPSNGEASATLSTDALPTSAKARRRRERRERGSMASAKEAGVSAHEESVEEREQTAMAAAEEKAATEAKEKLAAEAKQNAIAAAEDKAAAEAEKKLGAEAKKKAAATTASTSSPAPSLWASYIAQARASLSSPEATTSQLPDVAASSTSTPTATKTRGKPGPKPKKVAEEAADTPSKAPTKREPKAKNLTEESADTPSKAPAKRAPKPKNVAESEDATPAKTPAKRGPKPKTATKPTAAAEQPEETPVKKGQKSSTVPEEQSATETESSAPQPSAPESEAVANGHTAQQSKTADTQNDDAAPEKHASQEKSVSPEQAATKETDSAPANGVAAAKSASLESDSSEDDSSPQQDGAKSKDDSVPLPMPPPKQPATQPSTGDDDVTVEELAPEPTPSAGVEIEEVDVPVIEEVEQPRDSAVDGDGDAVMVEELPSPEVESPPEVPANDDGDSGASSEQAESEGCLLCKDRAHHTPKDCPIVQGGVDRVRARLNERKEELRIPGKRLNTRGDAVVDACKMWVTRLTKVADKVTNGTPQKPAAKPAAASGPVRNMLATNGTKTTVTPATPVRNEDKTTGETAAVKAPATAGADSALDSASSSSSSDADEAEENAPAAPTVFDTPSYPLALHLKAAAARRRPGSMSGLSVSDAVIETGDSDSDSDSSSGDSDDDSVETSSSSATSDSDSDSSSSAAADFDPADLLRRVMTKPLSQRQRKQARRSAASMHTVSQEDVSEVSDVSDSDEEIRATQARAGGRADSESPIGEFEDGGGGDGVHADSLSDDESDGAASRAKLLQHVAATSAMTPETSVPELGAAKDAGVENKDANVKDKADTDDASSSDSGDTDADEDDASGSDSNDTDADGDAHHSDLEAVQPESQVSGPSTRSLARLAGSSPAPPESAGDLALQEAIAEDGLPALEHESLKANGDLPATQLRNLDETPPSTQKKEHLPPMPGSQLRRSTRAASREPLGHASQPAPRSAKEGAQIPASQPPPASQPRRSARVSSRDPEPPASQPRRTRAASRDSASGPATQSQRVTRSSSRDSRGPTSPRASKASLSLPVTQEVDERSSDPAEPPSSHEAEPPLSSLPNGSSTVNGKHTQSSQSLTQSFPKTQSSPLQRKRSDSNESPLFMTQGSQLPATQAYASIPPPLVPETQEDGDGDVQMSDGEESGHESGNDDGSESDDDSPFALSLPRSQAPAAPPPSSFPTLSSLPKDLLRQGGSVAASMWNRVTGTGVAAGSVGGRVVNGRSGAAGSDSSDDDSDTDTDTSDEADAAIPEKLKGRFAGRARVKPPRTRGAMRGW